MEWEENHSNENKKVKFCQWKFETKTTQQFGGMERLWSKCTISCHKLSIQENEIWKKL